MQEHMQIYKKVYTQLAKWKKYASKFAKICIKYAFICSQYANYARANANILKIRNQNEKICKKIHK